MIQLCFSKCIRKKKKNQSCSDCGRCIRLVKLAARAFYDDITTKGDNQPKTGRSDNRGIAVVVLDALTRFGFETSSSAAFGNCRNYLNDFSVGRK